MAQLARKPIVIEVGYEQGWQEKEKAALDAAAQEARSASEGDLVGEIIQWHRGDGYAQYMVIKQKPLTLAHLEIGDAWNVEDALIRGLRVSDVRQMVEQERAMQKLFSKGA